MLLRNSRALNFSNSTGLSLLFIVLQCIILPRVLFHPAEQLENLEGAEQWSWLGACGKPSTYPPAPRQSGAADATYQGHPGVKVTQEQGCVSCVCRECQPSTAYRQSPSQAWQLFQLSGMCWRWNWLILNKGRQKSSAFASQTFLLQGSSVAGLGDLLGRWRYLHSWGFIPQCQEPWALSKFSVIRQACYWPHCPHQWHSWLRDGHSGSWGTFAFGTLGSNSLLNIAVMGATGRRLFNFVTVNRKESTAKKLRIMFYSKDLLKPESPGDSLSKALRNYLEEVREESGYIVLQHRPGSPRASNDYC